MRMPMMLAGAAALLLTSSVVLAQTPMKPRTAASMECSKQADAKGLKGKPRKAFRSKCKREMAKKPA